MAQFYSTLGGTYTTVRVLSPLSAIDVEAIPIVTIPHAVRMTVLVPLDKYNQGAADTYLNAPAELVEELLGTGGSGTSLVSDVVQVQASDSARLLAYYLDLTVTYVSPSLTQQPFNARVRLPMTSFETLEAYTQPLPDGQNPDQVIEAAYAQLQATAGL